MFIFVLFFFENCNLTRIELLHTSLKDIDLRSCLIEGLKISGNELKGAVVTEIQALELVRFLGVIVE